MMTTGFARWSIPFALLPLSAATLSAQSTGTIRGLLKDPSGNSMPGVHVRLLSNATQQQSETLSTDAGTYVFTFLAPGAYQLSAEAPGFKRYVHDNVTVEVAGTTTLDPVLELGQVTEQVGPEPGSAGRYQQQCSGWSCRTENGHGSSPFQPQFHSNPQPLARCQLGCSKCGRVGS